MTENRLHIRPRDLPDWCLYLLQGVFLFVFAAPQWAFAAHEPGASSYLDSMQTVQDVLSHAYIWIIFLSGLLLGAMFYWNRRLSREVEHRRRIQQELHDQQLMLEKRVTERTDKLKESEALTRDILTGTNAGTWDWNIAADKVRINARWLDIIGREPDEFPTFPFIDKEIWASSVHPADLKRILGKVEQNLMGKLPYYDVEFRQQHKSGDWVWVNARGKVVERNETGLPLRMSGTHLDISARKQAEEQLMHQAHFDGLTGLPNRFLTLDRLGQLIIEAQRSHTKAGLLFLDLDDFKKINDSLGHDAGDAILVEAGHRLRELEGKVNTIGRLGGDEFVVLVSDLQTSMDIRTVAEEILTRFRKTFEVDNRELVLTSSIGVAVYPDDGRTASELLRNADSAMYHSKQQGRNTFSFFTDAMNEEVSRRLNLEEHMRRALERGEFELYFQPKIEIATQKVVGAEALLRWSNAELGWVTPDEFIPIAEQNGMIVPIGQFVLEEAARVSQRWFQQFGYWFGIAVNLSPRQFRDPGLLAFIEKTLETHGVEPQYLEFEITEGVLMTGHSAINDALHRLSALGATLTMDDFGTGYSSLSYLRKYPFDVVKIDRSFINDINADEKSLELVNAAIAMSHGLGMQVVAEGVETEDQLAALHELNCDVAQGYLFGEAMPMVALEKRLSDPTYIQGIDA